MSTEEKWLAWSVCVCFVARRAGDWHARLGVHWARPTDAGGLAGGKGGASEKLENFNVGLLLSEATNDRRGWWLDRRRALIGVFLGKNGPRARRCIGLH